MQEHSHTTQVRPEVVPYPSRVVCGIDGSPVAEEAARKASVLMPEDGRLHLVSVVVPGAAEQFAPSADARHLHEEHRASALASLTRAAEAAVGVRHVIPMIRSGSPATVLETEAELMRADALVLGCPSRGRAAGVLLGSVATRLLHRSVCSVLIGRAVTAQPFPVSIAVGVDTSGASLEALRLGAQIAERCGVPLRALHVAGHGAPVDWSTIELHGAEVVEIRETRSPTVGLTANVGRADLLVVGSRGLTGLRALGSVSEAVAHRSESSVLVIR
jgi:nucleotide-binding universal stress UspA family protein